MKIKIIKFAPSDLVDTMIHLEVGKILNVEEELAMKLIKNGYAILEI